MLRRRFVAATASGLFGPALVRAQTSTEALVKARVALNLARFTQWPAAAFADPAASHVWCTAVRDGTMARALGALGGELVGGHAVLPLAQSSSLPQGCHVLFVDAEAERGAAALLAEAGHAPVLTIGDGEAFSRRGIVGLVNVNDSIRFDINIARMRAAHLNISSQVLRLARTVHE